MQTWLRHVILVFSSCLFSINSSAAEISAFSLTEFNGELALRYIYDEQSISQSDADIQKDVRPTFQQELKLNSSSYIYHPYLLNMDISGGVVLDQSQYESLDADSSTDEELVNINAKFNFLEKKPYPITIYYNQQNPSVSTGIAGHFIQENIRYGIDAAVMEPLSPVLISIKAFHQTAQGEGFEQIVNDDEKQAVLRIYSSYASEAHIELTHQESQLVSSSGSTDPSLLITTRESSRSQTNFDSRNVFGRRNQVQLTTNATSNTQDQYPVRDEITLTPAISWKHSDELDSYYRMYFLESTEELLETDLTKFDTGVAYHSDVFNTGLSLQAEDHVTKYVESSVVGVKYNYSYKTPVAYGKFQLNFNALFDTRDQADSRDQTVSDLVSEVYGELHVLNSLDWVTLSRSYIDAATIVVWNANRTQFYTEGTDYSVDQVGFQTRIQRKVAGSILDGQTVLVDYSYETGGTFVYDRTLNNINLNWSILSSYDVYLRYQDSDVNLQEGIPSIQINSMQNYTYGVNLDKPLLNGIVTGAEIYREERVEDVALQDRVDSYSKQSAEAFIEMPLPNLTNIRLSARHIKQDNVNTEQDTDLDSVAVRVQSRPWLRGSMSWESRYENDIGGSDERQVQQHRLRLSWNIRQLSVGAAINYGKEKQGIIERDRWEAHVTASRSF